MRSKSTLSVLLFVISTLLVSSQEKSKEISHYIFPSFIKGKILLKAGITKEAMMNYNSITEEMIFESNGTRLAISNPENVDTIFISGRKFITAGATYYELLESFRIPLFVRHLCNVTAPGKDSGYGGTSQTNAINTASTMFAPGKAYEMKLPDGYIVDPYLEYDLKIDNDYKRIYNTNTVIKYFPDKKDAIKEFVKTNKTNFKKENDVRSLIAFCNK